MGMLHQFGEVNTFFSNVLIPLALFALYCGSFAYLSLRLLPVGVNYYFANKSWKVALILLGVMCLVFIGLFVVQKGSKFSPGKTNEKSSARDLLLIALPLTPVVQYILNNQDILSPIESLTVLAFFILFASLLIFAIPAFLGSLGSTRTGMILGLAFVYTITSMASLSNAFFWHKSGNLKIELLFAGFSTTSRKRRSSTCSSSSALLPTAFFNCNHCRVMGRRHHCLLKTTSCFHWSSMRIDPRTLRLTFIC